MPRNDQVTRQWHLLQPLSGARQGLTLAQVVDAISLRTPPKRKPEAPVSVTSDVTPRKMTRTSRSF